MSWLCPQKMKKQADEMLRGNNAKLLPISVGQNVVLLIPEFDKWKIWAQKRDRSDDESER